MAFLNRRTFISDRVLLDLINLPNMTIDEIVDRHLISKPKLYENMRIYFNTTPGRWRKLYWRGLHWASRFYTNAFQVTLDHEFQDERVSDSDYIDPILSTEDVPLWYDLSRVDVTIDGECIAFRTERRLIVDDWVNVSSEYGKYTLSIRLTRGGRNPTITAFLSRGGHRGGQIEIPYTDLKVYIKTELVSYDVRGIDKQVTTLAVPDKSPMYPISPSDLFDFKGRSVYFLTLGKQTIIIGLYEGVDQRDVEKLNVHWRQKVLNNDTRREIRKGFEDGTYIDVSIKEGLKMQDRVCSIMDAILGVPVCVVEVDHGRYLVRFDDKPDLVDVSKFYPYMKTKPERVASNNLALIAKAQKAQLVYSTRLLKLFAT